LLPFRKNSARSCARVNLGIFPRERQPTGGLLPHKPVAREETKADNGGGSAGEWNVKIEIYDQAYNVNADGNEEYLKELAAYVDGKMRSVADETHMVDSLKVAVLAALNIADESFTLRKRQQEIAGPLRKRVEKCVSMVEKALEQTN
jgi:cell division protein ZapA